MPGRPAAWLYRADHELYGVAYRELSAPLLADVVPSATGWTGCYGNATARP